MNSWNIDNEANKFKKSYFNGFVDCLTDIICRGNLYCYNIITNGFLEGIYKVTRIYLANSVRLMAVFNTVDNSSEFRISLTNDTQTDYTDKLIITNSDTVIYNNLNVLGITNIKNVNIDGNIEGVNNVNKTIFNNSSRITTIKYSDNTSEFRIATYSPINNSYIERFIINNLGKIYLYSDLYVNYNNLFLSTNNYINGYNDAQINYRAYSSHRFLCADTEKLLINNNINLSAPTIINNNLNVSGPTTLTNNLNVSGETTLTNNLNVSGITSVNSIYVNGTITANSIYCDALTTDYIVASSNLNVTAQNTIINGNLSVTGSITSNIINQPYTTGWFSVSPNRTYTCDNCTWLGALRNILNNYNALNPHVFRVWFCTELYGGVTPTHNSHLCDITNQGFYRHSGDSSLTGYMIAYDYYDNSPQFRITTGSTWVAQYNTFYTNQNDVSENTQHNYYSATSGNYIIYIY